jgi:hypothetical protein
MNKTVYIASFKGRKSGWHGLIGSIIRFATKSEYSHTETCVGNPFEGPVLCVSSVGTEGGVRGKVMQLDPKNWDIDPMSWVSEDDVTKFLAEYQGKGYDLVGCVRSVIPFVSREHPEKWFCTETASYIQKLPESWRFPPGDLVAIVRHINIIKDSIKK